MLKILALSLSCLLYSSNIIAQAPAGTIRSNNSSTVYLTAEVHTYSCGSDCWPEDFAYYGSQYDLPNNTINLDHNFAEDPCGNLLDAADIVAITFTEYTGGGLSASWTMSFCDLDNLWTYGSKTEGYWSPGFGVFFNVKVEYDALNSRVIFTIT